MEKKNRVALATVVGGCVAAAAVLPFAINQGGQKATPCGVGLTRDADNKPCYPLPHPGKISGWQTEADGTVKVYCRLPTGTVKLCLIDRDPR